MAAAAEQRVELLIQTLLGTLKNDEPGRAGPDKGAAAAGETNNGPP
jgi:hypothetical protein